MLIQREMKRAICSQSFKFNHNMIYEYSEGKKHLLTNIWTIIAVVIIVIKCTRIEAVAVAKFLEVKFRRGGNNLMTDQ